MSGLTGRVLGRASVLILALVLALGTTVPALAQDEDGLEQRGFSGIVTAVDLEAGTMTVETEEGELITITLTGDTRVRLPSGDVHSAAQVGVEVGASVAILAEVEDGSFTALWTLVKPEQPQVEHLLGTIISIEGNLITIMDAQGNEHTVEMPGQALQGLQVGDVATFVVGQSGTNGGEDGNLEVHDAVTAEQIQARVLMHANSLRERAEDGDVPVDDAEERIQFLSELMDLIQEHVEGVLTAVLEQVPEPAKDAIRLAIEQARRGFGQARAAIQQQGPSEDNGKPEWVDPPRGESGDDEEPEDEEPEDEEPEDEEPEDEEPEDEEPEDEEPEE